MADDYDPNLRRSFKLKLLSENLTIPVDEREFTVEVLLPQDEESENPIQVFADDDTMEITDNLTQTQRNVVLNAVAIFVLENPKQDKPTVVN